MTRKRKSASRRRGSNKVTPAQFARDVYKAVPGFISMDEAAAAVAKYAQEWMPRRIQEGKK